MRDTCLSVFVYHKMATLTTIGSDDNGLEWVRTTSHTKDGPRLVFLNLNLFEIAWQNQNAKNVQSIFKIT